MELSSWSAALQKASTERPKPDCKLSYGTAGFRTNANLLQSTVFRCGVLMALRSLKTSSVTGICITASHNPAPDNGVKLVDPSGEMLSQDYEGFADELANAETSEALVGVVKRFIETEGIDMGQAERGKVLLAFDTRPSGGPLAEDAAAGAGSLGVSVELLGMMTTPQLHWAVMRRNQGLESSEDAYYKHIAGAFGRLSGPTFSTGQERRKLHVDCANGVGALKLEKLKPYVVRLGLDFCLHNTGDGVLNGKCGSDFIQKERTVPEAMRHLAVGEAACAVDGDADRLVYFYRQTAEGDVVLLDGDKIAALVAGLFKELVAALPGDLTSTSIGVVQTAYANGSSTSYLTQQLQCEVVVTPTGVKHLHRAAHQFDIGIYFEANGHGTVLFRGSFLDALRGVQDASAAASEILALNNLINAAVGDAISDILLVEVALKRRGMDLVEWHAIYSDLPSRQLACPVKNRFAIVTEDSERRVSEPKELQLAIDSIMARFPGSRSFVRPSGTEDIVRIYAEAPDAAQTDEVADGVRQVVLDLLA